MLELAYGNAPPQQEEVPLPENAAGVHALSWRELQIVAAKLVAEIPAGDADSETVANAMLVVGSGDGTTR